jgi:hypothetical protein
MGRCLVTLSDPQVAVTDLVIDSTSVYWTASNGPSGGHVVKANLAGGGEITLAAASEPTSLVVDATNVWFTDLQNGVVLGVPIGGGTGNAPFPVELRVVTAARSGSYATFFSVATVAVAGRRTATREGMFA